MENIKWIIDELKKLDIGISEELDAKLKKDNYYYSGFIDVKCDCIGKVYVFYDTAKGNIFLIDNCAKKSTNMTKIFGLSGEYDLIQVVKIQLYGRRDKIFYEPK